ncbi:putative cytokinetic ring protein SteA [Caldicellulosiruptoraceae bacterium PP1]
MKLSGYAKKDAKTKNLVKRLKKNDIPIIFHEDIDEVAAYSLIEKGVKLVINCAQSFTGKYPANGVKILLENNIIIYDNVGIDIFNNIEEGDFVEINDDKLFINKIFLCNINQLDYNDFLRKYEISYKNMETLLDEFIQNTLEYARKEKSFILGNFEMPTLKTSFAGKQVLVVTRGTSFKKDIKAIKNYIKEVKPVIMAVDGAADALLDENIKPDIIIGDMDSISERSMLACKEIIVHSYTNGYAPGLKKVKEIGIDANIISCPGTSEDVALLLAYEKGAELIVSVGSHTNILDFLEKGRKGMASTLLVRLKIGSKLVDAKGVSKLYTEKFSVKYLLFIIMAALIPLFAIILTTPPFQYLFYFVQLKLKSLLR